MDVGANFRDNTYEIKFVFQIQKASSEAELTSVIAAIDPITMEDGASILMAAGVSTVLKLVAVPNAINRLMKFYTLGMYRYGIQLLHL